MGTNSVLRKKRLLLWCTSDGGETVYVFVHVSSMEEKVFSFVCFLKLLVSLPSTVLV